MDFKEFVPRKNRKEYINGQEVLTGEFLSEDEIQRGIERGEIEEESYVSEWAKDKDGVARPVGYGKRRYLKE
jgi:hypothetical protein